MDMFNKLKSSLSSNLSSTITATVYNTGNIISGVLPGNPVTREFEVLIKGHLANFNFFMNLCFLINALKSMIFSEV